MSVIEDLLAEGMAERVAAVSVPAGLAGGVWQRIRRRRARQRAVGLLATVLALAGLGALIPGLVATHGDPAQTASEPAGSPAPTALKAQLMAALNNDAASIERETVTGATGASGPIEYWYDPATGQGLAQALDSSGQRVLAQVAALEAQAGGEPLTVTEMDFVTRTWATATVSSAAPVPVPLIVPAPVATSALGLSPPAFPAVAGAPSAGPLAETPASVDTPAELQRTLQSGTLLVVGHGVIDGQDAVHLVVGQPRLQPTPSGAPIRVPEPSSYELWVDAATGQPIQRVVLLSGGKVQTVYRWLAASQVNLSTLSQVPTGFTQAPAPFAWPNGVPSPSPA